MSAESIYQIYRSSKVVWVEDDLTRELLTIAWRDPRIQVISAGSKAGVEALVRGAPAGLKPTVLGIVDLDFDRLNTAAWDDPNRRTLRFSVHEAENLLLDFELIAAVSRSHGAKVTPADVERVARGVASTMVDWMACKTTLHAVRGDVGAFPDPRALTSAT